jgi:peptidyl-prolyl cis-trans isomerase SurA
MIKNTMKKSIKSIFGISALLLCHFSQAETIPLDKVIAVVDNDVVMASEVHQRLQVVSAQLKAKGTEAPPINVLQRQIIEQLIVESLQLQIGDRVGINISEAEIDQHIERMKEANNLTEAQFQQQLQQDQINISALRQQIRRDIIIENVQRGSVNRRIKVSEQDVKNFLNSKQGKFWSAPDYNLGHILIPVNSDASINDLKTAETKANEVYKQLNDGTDFRQVAVRESKGQNALQGGDLGWKKLAQLPNLFSQALSDLKEGDITQPLRSGAGFHILKVHGTRGSTEKIIQQSKARHILLKTSAILNDQQAKQRLTDIRQQVLDGDEFSELAKEHSQDTGSVLSGGDLGWSLPGKFVPEFEKVIDETSVGDVSEPFHSQFGWHIVMVDERRQQDMTEEVRENQATRLLRSRRFDEERINWIQKIRSEAFIDIKI